VLGYGPRLKRLWERALPSKYSPHDLARHAAHPRGQSFEGRALSHSPYDGASTPATTQASVLVFYAACQPRSVRLLNPGRGEGNMGSAAGPPDGAGLGPPM